MQATNHSIATIHTVNRILMLMQLLIIGGTVALVSHASFRTGWFHDAYSTLAFLHYAIVILRDWGNGLLRRSLGQLYALSRSTGRPFTTPLETIAGVAFIISWFL